MANSQKGQVSFQADGETYLLEMTPNAYCELEDEAGMDTLSFVSKIQAAVAGGKISFKDLRLLMWAALTEHHEGLTTKDAGDVMKAVGFERASDLVLQAINGSFPEDQKKKPGKTKKAKKPAARR
jgi:hypothetical protein